MPASLAAAQAFDRDMRCFAARGYRCASAAIKRSMSAGKGLLKRSRLPVTG